MSSVNQPYSHESIIVAGRIIIDRPLREIRFDDELVSLRQKEFEILLYLILNKKRVVSASELRQKIWHTDYTFKSNTLFVHIHNLRSKLTSHSGKSPISTIYGSGFMFSDDVDS